ncbi:hypothetical protein OB236_07185 [Paenibacillus sp. WQ 127069]|uniref:Alpha/beta hydrolase n=1 Tax=Paenibacillus baimaensis TaxID=2982185 RepID=A0ABT2UD27_9BACL|nr:hypothetical protein [Paenibacillus sp. WQ 127069]MCU6791906.1 hypothetical protein [Paenibacillus sp. WQ 127069]
MGRVLLIAGGKDRKVPFDEMARLLPDHVKVLLVDRRSGQSNRGCSTQSAELPAYFQLRRPGRGSGADAQAGRTGRHGAA